jgi:hypothetical protein
MPLKSFAPGEVLTASDVNEYLVNSKFAVATATETAFNNSTPHDDAQLFIPNLTANATYLVIGMLVYQSATAAPDIAIAFTMPAGANMTWSPNGITPTDGDQAPTQQAGYVRMPSTSAGVQRSLGTQAGNELVANPMGLLTMGGTSGTLQFRWAQNLATSESTQRKANSFLWARRVA